jgi:ATP-dependent RNA helicase RhlE
VRSLEAFRSGRARVLVATDIAARGIDVPLISHVINYELPNEPESYVHRIGRTARAGAGGSAISFCDASERPYLRAIEGLTKRTVAVAEHRFAQGQTGPAEHHPKRSQPPAGKRPRRSGGRRNKPLRAARGSLAQGASARPGTAHLARQEIEHEQTPHPWQRQAQR